MEGAFEKAKNYTATKTRRRSSHVESPIDDPSIQRHFGELYVQIESARLLVDKTDEILVLLYEKLIYNLRK